MIDGQGFSNPTNNVSVWFCPPGVTPTTQTASSLCVRGTDPNHPGNFAITPTNDTSLTVVDPVWSLAPSLGGSQTIAVFIGMSLATTTAFSNGYNFTYTTGAPACGSLQQCQGTSGSDASGAVVATSSTPTGPITATGQGAGGITVGRYGANPVGTPTFDSAGSFFDVKVSAPNAFSAVTITNCDLGGGTAIDWWNPAANAGHGAWQRASNQAYTPGPPACVAVTIGSNTSPTITQLQGTVFAAERVDLMSLTATRGLSYANQGPITSGDLRLTPQGTGPITALTGSATLPGSNGGTATITFTIHQLLGSFDLGMIRVVDPGAHIDQTAIVLTASLPRDGTQGTHGSATGIALVGHRLVPVILTWSVLDVA